MYPECAACAAFFPSGRLHVEKFPAMAPRVPNACVDREDACPDWAAKGECKSNTGFMLGTEGYDGALPAPDVLRELRFGGPPARRADEAC